MVDATDRSIDCTRAPNERKEMLRDLVSVEVKRLLGVSRLSAADCRRSFFDLGMDSLRAMDLKLALEQNLECDLASTLVFDHPTVERMVEYLSTDVPALGAGAKAPAAIG